MRTPGDIINIDDWKIQRLGQHRIAAEGDCDHKHIELDERGDIVRCMKCGIQLSAFWALKMLSDTYNQSLSRLKRERQALTEAKEKDLHLLAARKVERAWRRRDMTPACPHCGEGILPEDGLGNSLINRAMVLRKRESKKKS